MPRSSRESESEPLTLGQALNAAGDTPAAESVLREAVRTAPGEWRAWNALGSFLATNARPKEAADEAEAAADAAIDLEQQSDDPDPQNVFNPDLGATHHR